MQKQTISQNQYQRLISEITMLKKAVLDLSKNELKSAAIKKLERGSRDIEKGKGRKFKNINEFSRYLRQL